MPRVYHYCPSIIGHDAIGFSLTTLHRAMLRAGVPSFLVCDSGVVHNAPPFTLTFEEFAALKPLASDVILFHYSFLDRNAAPLLQLPCRKVMIYHNITPGHFFRQFGQDWLADRCDEGRETLHTMKDGFDVVVGDSGYNAAELAEAGYPDPQVVPVFYDNPFFSELGACNETFIQRHMADEINLVFIGRYVPNKRPDNLLRLCGIIRNQFGLPVRLRLHGKVWDQGYFMRLRRLSEELGVEHAVSFEINQPREALRASLASADAFVSVSEHEGFMVPLVEAFSAGCPVVALASSAVTETCGAAASVTPELDLENMAGRIVAIRRDRDLRNALVRGQSRRAEAFSQRRTLRKWDALLQDFMERPLVTHAHRI